ncbi:MAG: hypothetical protein KAH18_06530 [Psychromonas sp.]|nr:hypothetical protein [Psychromonas sp.]
MKKLIIVLLSIAIFYIPASYAEKVTVCASPDSIDSQTPTVQLLYNSVPMISGGWKNLPAAGKCESYDLVNSRAYVSEKKLQVMFHMSSWPASFHIGDVTFDNPADFDNCMVNVQYLYWSLLKIKVRAGKGCLSLKPTIPFRKISMNP